MTFLFPQPCVFCKSLVPKNCLTFPVCMSCDSTVMFREHKQTYRELTVYSIATYQETVQTLLHAFKYQGLKKLGGYFAQKIVSCHQHTVLKTIDYIVPVPIHRSKQYERGFNQVDVIACSLSRRLSIPVYRILNKKKPTQAQASLKQSERYDNVKESFCLLSNKLVDGDHILVIDDVMTTGSTLRACHHVLQQIRVTVTVSYLVIARSG